MELYKEMLANLLKEEAVEETGTILDKKHPHLETRRFPKSKERTLSSVRSLLFLKKS